MQRGGMRGAALHPFLNETRQFVWTHLREDRNIADYILLYGLADYAVPVEQLALPARIVAALKPARIATLGQLVSRTATELEQLPGLGRAEIAAVRSAVASRGFELAPRPPRPRDPSEPVGFAAEYIYHRDLDETIYEWSRGVRFSRKWPRA